MEDENTCGSDVEDEAGSMEDDENKRVLQDAASVDVDDEAGCMDEREQMNPRRCKRWSGSGLVVARKSPTFSADQAGNMEHENKSGRACVADKASIMRQAAGASKSWTKPLVLAVDRFLTVRPRCLGGEICESRAKVDKAFNVDEPVQAEEIAGWDLTPYCRIKLADEGRETTRDSGLQPLAWPDERFGPGWRFEEIFEVCCADTFES
ncbi:hypothetical protein B0H16DRAFT_1463388 [Mycena metata]|uniref:Uncharacterized protein n=1 Tax=Mycena metata TaxID=1033252 RepID=A0AAD7N3P4_9AGAR|nr:hypothetical protein B0H16DRAFT_1463388 [Mycena metata]